MYQMFGYTKNNSYPVFYNCSYVFNYKQDFMVIMMIIIIIIHYSIKT